MGCIVLDVIGIGLGPFNLSLAALLVQANESKKAVTSNITSLFFEKIVILIGMKECCYQKLRSKSHFLLTW